MKIDDIFNSNDNPVTKAKKANELYNTVSNWIDKQDKETQEKHYKEYKRLLSLTIILFRKLTNEQAEKIISSKYKI